MRKAIHNLLFLFLISTILACGGVPTVTDTPQTETVPSVETPLDTPIPSTQVSPTISVPMTSTPIKIIINRGENSKTPENTATPHNIPPPTATIAPLFYNLPPTMLTSETGLYASPNRSELIVPVTLPVGETIYVMGRNATNSHLRVVWNTGVGWVPISFTNYNGRREKLTPLPVFTREPPACAEPITTQFGLNSNWTSDSKQRVAVVIDLFRSRYGDFPRSFLSLTVNGLEVESSKRQIVEKGQFSLKDVVFTLPRDVQPGDAVGYFFDTSSDEPVTFMATIFAIPGGCQWKLD